LIKKTFGRRENTKSPFHMVMSWHTRAGRGEGRGPDLPGGAALRATSSQASKQSQERSKLRKIPACAGDRF